MPPSSPLSPGTLVTPICPTRTYPTSHISLITDRSHPGEPLIVLNNHPDGYLLILKPNGSTCWIPSINVRSLTAAR